ncbi:meiotic recombination protein REC114 isoform X2 [Leucoraja erinacea]|uniref:meiotic recombination protein REC114 isoform X2 n=1 Tax=Leucoraja erinaceus TaxID=7782 RepID=UPI002454A693|nr:meiotic recombination protein REC114 isoform X2 [Leucoraja erinacea]
MATATAGHSAGQGGTVAELLSTSRWDLKRYARFTASGGAPSSWEVFESSLEKGFLSLTIVESGHFLISRGGTTLLEGFSLIEAHKWWKAVRNADCVLFGSKVKNESRMFRVQFNGDSHKQALEHCSNCVQKLLLYIHVQYAAGKTVNEAPLLSQPADSNQSGSLELESMLGDKSNLPLAYQQSTLNTEELGPFLRLCLMDQSFPAFVEQVEQELKKLIEE